MNHPFFIRNDLTKHDLRSVLEADLISLNLSSLREKDVSSDELSASNIEGAQ